MSDQVRTIGNCPACPFGEAWCHGVTQPEFCAELSGHPDPGRPDALASIPLAGDLVEALAKRIGADRLARLWEQWTGKPCNCSQRKEAMNRASEKLLKWARRLGLI
jgi:hypothetical protein